MKKYRRPLASTGMTPKGHIPFKLDASLGHLIARRLRRHAEAEFDASRTLKMIAHAIDMFKRSSHPSKTHAGRVTPKAQKAKAAKIAKHARALIRAIESADDETIKRLAQHLAFGEGPDARKGMRYSVLYSIPEAMKKLSDAADYGIARAERHQGRGRRGAPLQALVVDLARIWLDQTGKRFVGSRVPSKHTYETKADASRSFIEIALYDVLGFNQRDLPKKRLDWLVTNARTIVDRDEDIVSSASSESGYDRDWRNAE